MSDQTKLRLEYAIPGLQQQQQIRAFARSRQTHGLIKAAPNCGHSYRIPATLHYFTSKKLTGRFILIVEPTDEAAAYVSQYMQDFYDSQEPKLVKCTSLWLDPWKRHDLDQLSKHDFWFVSARQILSFDGANLLKKAAWVVMDEVHLQSADQELALAVVRTSISKGALPSTRVVMLSAYMEPALTGASMIPDAETLDLGYLLDQATSWTPNLRYHSVNLTMAQDQYFNFVESLIQKSPRGPILIFVPGVLYIAPLIKMIQEKGELQQWKKSDWKTRVVDLGKSTRLEPHIDPDTITISLPFFHTQRAGSLYRYVISPHWVFKNWLDKTLGKDFPHVVSLTSSEIKFLSSHSTRRAFVSCMQEDLVEYPLPLVLQTDPAEYYFKAHWLFPGCAHYEGLQNSLPLRLFHSREQIFWNFHQFNICNLATFDRTLPRDEVILTERGKLTVSHIINLGLSFKWATFIQYVRDCIYSSGVVDRDSIHQGMVQICLPLALLSTLEPGRLLSRTGEQQTKQQTKEELLGMIKDKSVVWKYACKSGNGDLWCEALLLLLHLEGNSESVQGNGSWQVTLPNANELRRRVEYANEFYFEFQDEPWSVNMLFERGSHSDLGENATFGSIFVTSLAGARFFNLAVIKLNKDQEEAEAGETLLGSQASSGSQASAQAPLLSGIEVATGKSVYVSPDSTVVYMLRHKKVKANQVLVCYDEIKAAKPDTGFTFVISGITRVTGRTLNEASRIIWNPEEPWDQDSFFHQIIGYPFASVE